MLENDKWGNKFRRVGKQISRHCGEIRHSDGRNQNQVEIIQENGKTGCDRAGRKKNRTDDDGGAAIYEEERRR